MIALSFLIGIFIVMPIGGADMPVVLSLNSYAGLAAAATGFAINNKVLSSQVHWTVHQDLFFPSL